MQVHTIIKAYFKQEGILNIWGKEQWIIFMVIKANPIKQRTGPISFSSKVLKPEITHFKIQECYYYYI